MTIVQLFQSLHEHLPPEFAENLVTNVDTSQLWLLDFDESGVQIKNILESTYTDGITGLEDIKNDGKQITGVFLDKISPTIIKKYSFTISPNNISYQLKNPNDLGGADFAELEFAASKMFGGSKKPKNYPNSTPCGFSCIKKGLKCSKPPNPEQEKAIAGMLDKGKKTATSKTEKPKVAIQKEKVAPRKNKGNKKTSKVDKRTPESIAKDFEQSLKEVTDLRTAGDKEVAVQIAGAIDRADALRRAVASGSQQSIAEALPEAITKLRESSGNSPIDKFSKTTLEYAKSQYDKLPDNLKSKWANNEYTGLKKRGEFSQQLYDNFANKSSIHKQIADDLKKYID